MHSSAQAGGLGEECDPSDFPGGNNSASQSQTSAFPQPPRTGCSDQSSLSKPHVLDFSGDSLLLTNSAMSSGLQKAWRRLLFPRQWSGVRVGTH